MTNIDSYIMSILNKQITFLLAKRFGIHGSQMLTGNFLVVSGDMLIQ